MNATLATEPMEEVAVPTLVIYGGAGPEWSRNGAEALIKLLPHAERQTLEGQFHQLTPDALTPVLVEFFK